MKGKEKKDKMRAQIEAAATKLFLKHGLAETRITDIAELAGVSPSTIYLYYSGKKQLFESLNIPEAELMRPELERRRGEILQIALALFGARGFEGTTMDDIAAEAAVSKATLYQYCAGKEDLFFQVLQLCAYTPLPRTVLELPLVRDWRKAIHQIGRSFISMSHDPQRAAFLGAVIRDSNRFPEFGRVYYERSLGVACRNLAALLRELRDREEIRPLADADLDALAFTYIGSLLAYSVVYRIIRGVPKSVEEESYLRLSTASLIKNLEKEAASSKPR